MSPSVIGCPSHRYLESRGPFFRYFDCAAKMICLLRNAEIPDVEAHEILTGLAKLASSNGTNYITTLSKRINQSISEDVHCVFPKCGLSSSTLIREFRESSRIHPYFSSKRVKRSQVVQPRTRRKRPYPPPPHRPRRPTLIQELFRHPIISPDEAEFQHECEVCRAKQSLCTSFSIGTYGICGAAWLVAGPVGRWTCNIVSAPRGLDCLYNTWENCFLRDCGVVDLDFLEDIFDADNRAHQ
ncbi:uncharacterized protein LOC131888276 isoform X2 [Tigriopus californicus]|uniref:uncharacterized protein LOC131888276 isoform X2 n=1 Tax=Tigriopus californicus TaxID=6832 RepID=UPI0027DA387F|nr:uncharacterized protein LOC131888276 isoform X2 [Tigriopus californicus]